MEILTAIGILGGLGLGFGLILGIAAKVFYVETDPRMESLTQALPGANCGGCGYPGCSGYAQAVLDGTAPIGLCVSGGNPTAQAMARIMGVEAQEVTRKVALVRCAGYKGTDSDGKPTGSKLKGVYEGIPDCLAASKVAGRGPLICKYGCLGFGSCTQVCGYDAIHIVSGVARVDPEKCVGCMACAQVCPRQLIVSVDYGSQAVVACASKAKGAVTRRSCTAGCIGCGLCMKTCPEKAIRIEHNLAVIDAQKCTSCGLCVTVCPQHLISVGTDDPAKDFQGMTGS